jgi:hypothetical protein
MATAETAATFKCGDFQRGRIRRREFMTAAANGDRGGDGATVVAAAAGATVTVIGEGRKCGMTVL